MDTQNKQELLKEKDILVEELNGLGIFDPETKRWNAVAPREEGEETESDKNDLADRFEDFQERSAKIDILTRRLEAVEEKINSI